VVDTLKDKSTVMRKCQNCGVYDYRYSCWSCKLDSCYNCYSKWHEDRMLDHPFVCILRDGLIKLVEKED